MRSVCVIGLGLIGGSVLRAAAAAGRTVWGATGSTADSDAAAADGFAVASMTEALKRAADEDALVVLAVPLPAVDEVLRQVADVAPHCLLTDVVSVKGPVADAVARSAPETRFAGGHPMAGTSASGWSASTADLFRGAAWVVVADDDTDLTAWRAAADLAIDCGAHVVPVTADEHDAAVARISHLPHVLAAVLASCGADGGPLALALAAGSFGDGTRVMGSRPELVLAMCEGNRPALLAAVDDALGKLGAARGALASTGSLGATIRAGHAGRAKLVDIRSADTERVTVDLTGRDAIDELQLVGVQGGRVVAFTGDIAIAELPVLEH
ncbi:prephenate dehydrogenase [Actinokineospora alba]|uniref:Prephenate dehydrogenase n=1 Tax=Actinokineospora alba TaxID=504798 RepID=A0A1H0T557_9PSEU|nr:prephenate dehydrogenase [Actinokineospora alba]TDP66362.1 prephenate dehydrogenase [Actinokineospora alba]SDJ22955.1 prephenate dehydrogenase [Actinokineospora alba]SDP49163.1 prephenate dehydrogenase [Actinokineospora alba]